MTATFRAGASGASATFATEAPAVDHRARDLESDGPVDLARTLSAFRVGGRDPSLVIDGHAVWRASRTPAGPATLRLRAGDGRPVSLPTATIALDAWGPGAAWALDHAPELIGSHDDAPFDPPPGIVRDAHRRHPGWRVGASRSITEVLIPTILEQKVTTAEAHRSYHAMMRRFGEPAPGPAGQAGMRLRPEPARLARLAYHDLHRCGVERRRADAILRVCRRAARLDGFALAPTTAGLAAAAAGARRALESLPGIGPWTSATVTQQAFGDPDAVIVGDYHLPHLVTFTLAGEERGSDARMLELLEPYAGQRGRAVRLLAVAGRLPPKRAPGRRLRAIADI